MNKKILKILALSLVLLPLFVSAAVNIENYPASPFTQTVLTPNSQLGEIIKYFMSWIIALIGVIILISLVTAGSQYMTSSGDPGKMGEAKDRIMKSFLGILILLGSYLILSTVNPQLTILKVDGPSAVKTAPITPTNPKATKDIKDGNPVDEKDVGIIPVLKNAGKTGLNWFNTNILKKKPKATSFFPQSNFLSKFISSVQAQSCSTNNEVNFDTFEFDSIFLLKDNNGNLPKIKIIAFEKENFQGESRQVFPADVKDLTPVSGSDEETGEIWQGVLIPKEKLFFNSANLNGQEVLDENGNKMTDLTNCGQGFYHPALSVKILGTGPGVYLYSSNDDQRWLADSSYGNLASSDMDFDNLTTKVGIQNENGVNDYLAIAFEDADYQGQFKMFFENKERNIFDGSSRVVKSKDKTGNASLVTGDTEMSSLIKNITGSVVADQYGKVKDPSSVMINIINSDPSSCQEVRLCTGPEYFGDCLVYLPNGKSINDIDWSAEAENVGIVVQNMPLYNPMDVVPSFDEVKYKNGQNANGIPIISSRKADFKGNIYSIKIKGSCLVGLFENSTANFSNNGPGKNSQVFVRSDYDLNPANITNCRPFGGLGFWQTQSCVSSIVVFPTTGY